MTTFQLGLIAVLAPLASALVLVFAAPLRRSGRPAAILAIAAAMASFTGSAMLVYGRLAGGAAELASVGWLPQAGVPLVHIGMQIDGISAVMLLIVSLVALCVQVFSLEYMSEEPDADFGRYYTWHSLFLFSMQALVVAPNMLQLFVSWELVGLCSYLLIGFWYRKPSAARAAVKAFWMTKLADMGFLIGLLVHYAYAASFGWDELSVSNLYGAGALTWVAVLYFIGVMGKSAQFPLHVWLPDAMEGPTPVSALLHAATMVAAGVYLLVRAFPLFAAAGDVLPWIAVIGGFTAVFAACIAIVQTDIKRVLAYSTVSQLGYMVAAIGSGSVFAAYFHLGTHAFFKALLFLAAGSVIHAVHSNELSDMGGLRRKMPITTVVFVIGSAALAGLPLFSGFFSKDAILESLMRATHSDPIYWFPFLACAVTVALTAYYMARVVFLAFFGAPSKAAEHAHEGGWAMLAPMVVLALGSVLVGYGGGSLVDLMHLHGTVHFDPLHVTEVAIIGTLLAVLGIAAAWALDHRGHLGGLKMAFMPVGRFIRAGAVDRAWDLAYRRVAMVLAKGIAWFDRYVVDGLMNLVGAGSLIAGERIRRVQTGNPSDYVLAAVLGALVLGVLSQLMAGGVI